MYTITNKLTKKQLVSFHEVDDKPLDKDMIERIVAKTIENNEQEVILIPDNIKKPHPIKVLKNKMLYHVKLRLDNYEP